MCVVYIQLERSYYDIITKTTDETLVVIIFFIMSLLQYTDLDC